MAVFRENFFNDAILEAKGRATTSFAKEDFLGHSCSRFERQVSSLLRCNFKRPINISLTKRDVYVIICRETRQVGHSQSTKETEGTLRLILLSRPINRRLFSFSTREIQYFDTIKFSDISIFLPITSRTIG